MILENKMASVQPEHNKDQKVILLLLDAAREDFFEWDAESRKHTRLDPSRPEEFKHKRISIFRELMEQQPSNTYFFPTESALPTLTATRTKSFVSGAVGNVYEM
jgi:predicted AlkP superfamily pyrophosphatase or phosphodiesterase